MGVNLRSATIWRIGSRLIDLPLARRRNFSWRALLCPGGAPSHHCCARQAGTNRLPTHPYFHDIFSLHAMFTQRCSDFMHTILEFRLSCQLKQTNLQLRCKLAIRKSIKKLRGKERMERFSELRHPFRMHEKGSMAHCGNVFAQECNEILLRCETAAAESAW